LEVEVPITPRGGAEALTAITDRHADVDVIFFSSDTLAIGAVQECHRRGWRIPERLAIAGYGNMDLGAELYPALTTVHVPRYDMGRRAVTELFDRLQTGRIDRKIIAVDFSIIDRDSA
jgi:LacI family gluconate utilization system Gnt-I transcriptional repressor